MVVRKEKHDWPQIAGLLIILLLMINQMRLLQKKAAYFCARHRYRLMRPERMLSFS